MNELFSKKFDSDEEDEEYIPDKKELKLLEEPVIEKEKANKGKVEAIWEKLKMGKKEEKVSDTKEKINVSDVIQEKEKIIDENKKSAFNLDDEIQKAMIKAKEMKNKTVTETIHFAGQKFEYNKKLTEEDEKKLKDKEKKKTHSSLDSLVETLEKKSNVNTYTKTKKDWDNYVETKKIQKELDYNRKDGFLQKKQFIEETNMRLIENKKNVKRAKLDH